MVSFLKVGGLIQKTGRRMVESTIIAYDDSEKLKFRFCLSQVKKSYPKLKDSYTYSYIEKNY